MRAVNSGRMVCEAGCCRGRVLVCGNYGDLPDVLLRLRDENWLFRAGSDRLFPGKKYRKQASGQIMATSTTKRTTTPRKSTASNIDVGKAASSPSVPDKPATDTPVTSPEMADAVVAPAALGSDAGGDAPEAKLVSFSQVNVAESDLKKRELIDLVVARSGIKKKDAKPVVEAMLAVLGETIAEGRELNLQPLGKLRINRAVERGNGRVIICKLRQSLSTPMTPGNDPLAEAVE